MAKITGTRRADILNGTLVDDEMYGLQGDDTLSGGRGIDRMFGGLGDDIYVVDNARDLAIENRGEGIDLVRASVSFRLGLNVENLTLTGTRAINATGNKAVNALTGNTGDNVLDGGLGADSMTGRGGNDTYVVDNAGDTIVELDNEGIDLVNASITHVLGDHLDNLTLTGALAIDGTGNGLANVITGNDAANLIDGGLGADTMAGGLGDDIYVVDDAGDTITEAANEGTDLVRSSITVTLGADLENLTLIGSDAIDGTGNGLDNTLVGNDQANTLTGLDGNDSLDGGLGDDVMIGGIGNDTYHADSVADSVTELADEGTDTVMSSVDWTLGDHVENLTLVGIATIAGTGNGLTNVLTGNDGNNRLDGLGGADSMAGGLGDDTYVVDEAGDSVTEASDEGTDTVESAVSYTLGANLDNLTLTGSDHLSGTGNALANTITGNSGDNELTGTGNDTLIGGQGWDTYKITWGDAVSEAINDGYDTIEISGTGGNTYYMPDNVETLILTSGSFYATGNGLDNTIIGNGNGNFLVGGGGNDQMLGGLGNDNYWVVEAGDTVIEYADQGSDIIVYFGSANYTLVANVENLIINWTSTGTSFTGNALANTISYGGSSSVTLRGGNTVGIGSSIADKLYGSVGNDTFIGTDGNITMSGGTGFDTADFSLFSVGLTASYTGTGDSGTVTQAGLTGNLSTLTAIDKTIGTSASDSFNIQAGTHTVTTGGGSDRIQLAFASDALASAAVILDFADGSDLLVFNTLANSAYDTAAEMFAAILATCTLSDVGGNLVIDPTANGIASTVITGLTVATFDASDLLII